MKPRLQGAAPDDTAVRVALWRALHVEADPPPRVFEDTIGLKLAAPESGWRKRPDMSPFTRPFGASILARARMAVFEIDRPAREAGFAEVRHVSAESLAQRYFTGRADGLRPPRNSEELLMAAAR